MLSRSRSRGSTAVASDMAPNPSLQRTITSVASLPRLLAAE